MSDLYSWVRWGQLLYTVGNCFKNQPSPSKQGSRHEVGGVLKRFCHGVRTSKIPFQIARCLTTREWQYDMQNGTRNALYSCHTTATIFFSLCDVYAGTCCSWSVIKHGSTSGISCNCVFKCDHFNEFVIRYEKETWRLQELKHNEHSVGCSCSIRSIYCRTWQFVRTSLSYFRSLHFTWISVCNVYVFGCTYNNLQLIHLHYGFIVSSLKRFIEPCFYKTNCALIRYFINNRFKK